MKKEKVKEWFYNNFLSILTMLAPVVSCVFSIIAKKTDNKLTWLEIVLLSFLAIETVVIIVKLAWNQLSYKSYYYPRSKIKANYELVEKELYYWVNEQSQLTFIRAMKIRSNIENLSSIFDKFIWTGSSPAEIPTPKSNVSEIKRSNRIGIWRYFQIMIDTPIAKGEERNIEYEWPVISNCTSSSPFFSTSTEEPTRKISMHLKLGQKYAGRNVILEEYRAIEGDNPIWTKQIKLDHCGDYTWTIDKPKRFRYYRMRWEWSLSSQSIPEIGCDKG